MSMLYHCYCVIARILLFSELGTIEFMRANWKFWSGRKSDSPVLDNSSAYFGISKNSIGGLSVQCSRDSFVTVGRASSTSVWTDHGRHLRDREPSMDLSYSSSLRVPPFDRHVLLNWSSALYCSWVSFPWRDTHSLWMSESSFFILFEFPTWAVTATSLEQRFAHNSRVS